jgi:hypothetical protein
MHRRYYILIAKVIRNLEPIEIQEVGKTYIISAFCEALKAEASSFNETKFRSYIEKGE